MPAAPPTPQAGLTRRALRATDLPGVLELETLTQSEPWGLREFQGELSRPFAAPWGFFATESLVAYFWAWLLPPETHLLRLSVTPAWRGRGLGARLLADLVELTRASQGDLILLEVAAQNERAIHLYRQAGFQIDGRARKYYASGDALRMSLRLRDWPGLAQASPGLFLENN
ncbi:MAG: GNAT family N-acetyltransferase [Deltaproteobacteria bacterium]|jgi:ribosomal-protein-alanine N-acetyltransferase|nr:GNAT family N-acetyltransferase [Deltaproteobacteria bacterium]